VFIVRPSQEGRHARNNNAKKASTVMSEGINSLTHHQRHAFQLLLLCMKVDLLALAAECARTCRISICARQQRHPVEPSGDFSLSILRAPAHFTGWGPNRHQGEQSGRAWRGLAALKVATTSAFEFAMETNSTLVGSRRSAGYVAVRCSRS
jgi:hypothetical protein